MDRGDDLYLGVSMKPSRGLPADIDAGSRATDNTHSGEDVQLSEAGYRMLAALEHASGPHKAGLAAVHRARAEIAANPELANIPLSEVVSALTRIADLPYLGEEYAPDPNNRSGLSDSEPTDLRLVLVQPRAAGKSGR